jgi:hypothetical protein
MAGITGWFPVKHIKKLNIARIINIGNNHHFLLSFIKTKRATTTSLYFLALLTIFFKSFYLLGPTLMERGRPIPSGLDPSLKGLGKAIPVD